MIQIEDMSGSGRAVECRRVVIKLGSNVVIDKSGAVDVDVIEQLAEDIAELRRRDVDVIIVTSGAVGLGRGLMRRDRPKTIPEKQAMAAVGQISLMHIYQGVLARRGLVAGQLLLTRADMESRKRYLNARHALDCLLGCGAIPIINENDTIATDELSFGDNDMLSAYVAIKMKADLLVLLSTVPGILKSPPGEQAIDPASIVKVIEQDSPELDSMIDDSQSGHGTGGMRSKLFATQEASKAGVHVVIAGGKARSIVGQVFTGDFDGTYIPSARTDSLSSHERWIGYGRASRGHELRLDAGAVRALIAGKKSLLPVGVTQVVGDFDRGDIIDLVDPEGQTFARGLVNYSSAEIEAVKGLQSSEVEAKLGARPYDALINRDNLVILQSS